MPLRTIFFAALISIAPLAAPPQTLPSAPSIPGMPPVPTSLEDRRKALAQVLHDYWEDVLKHDPELASALGDTRFNSQLTNYTAGAYNDAMARQQSYLVQLAVIDQAGFTDAEKQQMDALDRRLEADQKAAETNPWQSPINSAGGFFAAYPQLARMLPFTTAGNYDDWTARLQALPEAFAQAQQSMSLGIDSGNVPPKDLLDKALAEVTALAHQKPEDSPLAAPLKKFPASMGATAQSDAKDEMLAAIENDAIPAYLRLERFLQVSYVPAAGKGPAPDGTRDAQLLFAVLDLRAKAEQDLGAKFDVKAFHDAVIEAGLLPIEDMKKSVEQQLGIKN